MLASFPLLSGSHNVGGGGLLGQLGTSYIRCWLQAGVVPAVPTSPWETSSSDYSQHTAGL